MCAETVKVNGVLLASDIQQAKMSREKLLSIISQNGKFEVPSISTLRRAETGGPIELEGLQAIAHGLNFPVGRYIVDSGDLQAETLCKIGGAWEGYYVERDMDCENLGLVYSELTIVQHGAKLFINATETEESTTETEERTTTERTEETLDALIVRDMVMIQSRVAGWAPPYGVGYTLLKVYRGDEMMRGHAAWYDLDSEEIETSPCIYVRSDSRYRESYLNSARRELEAEILRRSKDK